jgi:hypothetical protein
MTMTMSCRSRGCEDIWNHGLGARESPTGKDMRQRGHYWDPLPGNDGRRQKASCVLQRSDLESVQLLETVTGNCSYEI